MTKPINSTRITIMHSIDSNMARRHTSRGPLFDAVYQGKVIVTNSTEPGLDSARVLKAMGLTGRLEIWDDHLNYCRFHLDIEKAAGLTIQEGEGRPIFRKFKPFAGHERLEGFSRPESNQIAQRSKKPQTALCATAIEHSEGTSSTERQASADLMITRPHNPRSLK